MKKNYFILIIFLTLVLVGGFYILKKFSKYQTPRAPEAAGFNIQNSAGLNVQNFNPGPQINNEGVVEVTIKPKNFSEKEWIFEISLNTHSEELNIDLLENALMLDDKGNKYRPIHWDGDPLGGHHRSGFLKFNPVLPLPESITIKILNIGGIKERSFVWQLK